jgi:hypothetical protein
MLQHASFKPSRKRSAKCSAFIRKSHGGEQERATRRQKPQRRTKESVARGQHFVRMTMAVIECLSRIENGSKFRLECDKSTRNTDSPITLAARVVRWLWHCNTEKGSRSQAKSVGRQTIVARVEYDERVSRTVFESTISDEVCAPVKAGVHNIKTKYFFD